MFQKNIKHGPKSTQNPVKMGPGTPWVSIVKLRSELYGFWVLFWVPLWPYFLTFFDVIFQHFPQPLFQHSFGRIMMLFWLSFGSLFSSFWGTPEKVKIWLSLQREHCFQGSRGSQNHTFLIKLWKHIWRDVFGTLFTDFIRFWSVWGVLWESFWDLISILMFEHFSLSFWPPLQP